jgi:Bacterial low temperature requirement A protein (LtrA)
MKEQVSDTSEAVAETITNVTDPEAAATTTSAEVLEEINRPSSTTTATRQSNATCAVSSTRRVSIYASQRYHVRLFSPPRQRQKWGDDQYLPRVNWGDLFFDLFYVAAFYNLGNILLASPTSRGLLYFLGCFFPILHLWHEKMWYDSRFVYGDDIFHKIFEVAGLTVLATAISYISPVEKMSNPSYYIDMFGFALSITLGSLLNIFRVVECYFWGRGQRKVIEATTQRDGMWKLVLLLFYMAATIISGIEYFGNNNSNSNYGTVDDNSYSYHTNNNTNETEDKLGRFLAGEEQVSTTAEVDPCNGSNTNIPILLALIGYVVSQVQMGVSIFCCIPANGEHKKM